MLVCMESVYELMCLPCAAIADLDLGAWVMLHFSLPQHFWYLLFFLLVSVVLSCSISAMVCDFEVLRSVGRALHRNADRCVLPDAAHTVHSVNKRGVSPRGDCLRDPQ